MVTCRHDLSFTVIKLSQYSNNPAEIHYQALKYAFRYLRATKDHGLYFWRTEPLLKYGFPPSQYPLQYHYENIHHDDINPAQDELIAYTDSNWASDSTHRRSVSGIAALLAGAVVSYKSKLQPTVALSSTEAEFSAASEAGKMVLYLRSILDDVNVPQNNATVLYRICSSRLGRARSRNPRTYCDF